MNVFAYLKAFAISSAVFLPLVVGAYFYGRSDGRALQIADDRAAAVAIHAQDSAVREDVENHNRASAESAAQTEVENDAVQQSLDTPDAGDSQPFASDQWVRDLQRIK